MDDKNSAMRDAVIDIAVESWRFSRTFLRLVGSDKLDAGVGRRYVSQIEWYVKKLNEALSSAGLSIVDVTSQVFEPGQVAATPLNIDDFSDDDVLVVDQMIEPIIVDANGLVRTGTVMLKKYESEA